ncbi:signal recognition particle, SRP9/SRP14 subunit [Absidia repens]|uniref:Signal recognition particle, SRP9/SRP14 subunit n=1 Tax=Absidia repens TaxID=90262 RepID=A0A1X2I6T4_9FUNG|nr:signal recognition particle, SRP9/SRP14 subunit [Absidia repens]
MYITNWDDFQKAAEDIFTSSPDNTRYVHAFHGSQGELVLKVTNDQMIVKYKTNQATDLKKFIGMNELFMSKMQNKAMDIDEPVAEVPATTSPNPADSPQIPQGASTASKSSKKKKSNKKKGGK